MLGKIYNIGNIQNNNNNNYNYNYNIYCSGVGRDSVVGTANRYELDGPGIESWWENEIFHTLPDQSWDPPSLLYNEYRVFLGRKSNREHKSTSRSEAKIE